MADVTGAVKPTNASAVDVAGDLSDVYDHFGGQDKYSVTTAASLPATGNWKGRRLMADDTGNLYVCTALPGTWEKVTLTDDTGEFQAASPTDLTFGSGWSHHNLSGWSGVRLRVKNGRVMLNGAAAKGSWANLDTIATLVAGYRPATQVQGVNCLVTAAGLVQAGFAGSVAISLRAEWDL